MRVWWAVLLVFWAGAGWAEDVTLRKDGNTAHVTTPGNLAPTQDPGCIGMDEAGADLSPPDLFLRVIHCLKKARAADAADLYVLMVARARFDALRVTDTSAHQAGSVLVLQLRNSVLRQDLQALQDRLTALGKPGMASWAAFCGRLWATGVPGHDPAYMVAQGMGALPGQGADPLVTGFDAAAAWRTMLSADLDCPAP